MKYKNIHSAIHNFGHSFLSLMNYTEGQYVRDLLWELRAQGNDIEIDWLSGSFSPPETANPVIAQSIKQYRSTLEEHLRSHDVDPGSIRELKLLMPSRGRIAMQALDDRNKTYRIYVNEMK